MWNRWRRRHNEEEDEEGEQHGDDGDDVTYRQKGAGDHMAAARNRSGPITGRWGQQHASGPVIPHQAQDLGVIDATDSLAAYLHQVNRDASGWSHRHLVNRQEFGELLWNTRARGWYWRMQAAKWLYRKYHFPITPDPLEPIPFRPETVVITVARMLGLTPIMVDEVSGTAHRRDVLSEYARHNIYAWIECYGQPDRPPDLICDTSSGNYILTVGSQGEFFEYPWFVLHAADCISQLLENASYGIGKVTQRWRILPPNPAMEPAPTTPAHRFRNALLDMGKECGQRSGCQCNGVLVQLREVPPEHPQETGALPHDPYQQQQARPAPTASHPYHYPPPMPPMPTAPYMPDMPETDPRLPARWRDDTPTHFPQAHAQNRQYGPSGQLPPRRTGPVVPQQQRGQDTPVLPALPENWPDGPDEEGG